MKYTVLIRKENTSIQLIMPGEVDTEQFNEDTFDTVVIDTTEDNIIDELTDIDDSWPNRFVVRFTPKPERKP